MLTYFAVPTSTTDVIYSANYVFNNWGNGYLLDLATIVVGTIFGMFILVYVLKHFHKD